MRSLLTATPTGRSLRLTVLLLAAACGGGGSDGPVDPPPAVTISVSPTTSTVDAGGTTTFSATVSNATNSAVTWSASGGSIAANGNSATWTAPFSGGPFTVTAASVAEPGRTASATVSVREVAVSVSPGADTVVAGGSASFTASVANSVNSAVSWSASGGTITSDTTSSTVSWTAPGAGGSYTLTATSAADPSRTGTVMVMVDTVMVAVTADSSTVAAAGTRTLSAQVTGAADTAVVWSATGGTIVGTGANVVWEAPAVGGDYAVTATSVLDPSMSASVSIAVASVAVSISPMTQALFRGEPTSYSATLTGAAPGRDSIAWSSTCSPIAPFAGDSVALTAPTTPQNCTVSARSSLDTSKVATATLRVRGELLVSSTDDVSDGACTFDHCSLREAIVAANAAPNVDTVLLGATVLPPSGQSSLALPATITLTNSLPRIESPMAILGPGAAQLTLDAAGTAGSPRRALDIGGSVAVTISGITITGGYEDEAGGVLVDNGADVLLDRVTVSGNIASDGPGGGAVVFGGSALRVLESLFENNQSNASDGNGGALHASGQSTLTVVGGTVRGNQARRGAGVGASESGVTLENVTIENNVSERSGGGASMQNSGVLTITGSVLRNNRSTDSEGGGMIAFASSLSSSQRVTVVLHDVLVENNQSSQQGSGIQLTRNVDATMTEVTIRGNQIMDDPNTSFPNFGAGIYGGEMVTLTLDHSTIANNRILSPVTFHPDDGGAGITFAADFTSNSLTIRNSTISGNESAVRAGGVFVFGTSTATITNSTISGNTAPTGGGVLASGTTVLRNVTITGNRAPVAGGGLRVDRSAVVQVQNALFADNIAAMAPSNCSTVVPASLASLGHNLSDDGTCTSFTGATNVTNTAAGLASGLTDNGGPTLTHALLAGSAAIDAGNATACTATDQRGVAREGACDIGAVEFTSGAPSIAAGARVPAVARAAFQRGAPRPISTRTPVALGEEAQRASGGRTP